MISSRTPSPTAVLSRLPWAACVLAPLALALAVRWPETDTVLLYADGMGPWLVARSWPGAHAPLYGAGLSLPHALILPLAGSLTGALGALLVLHALAAPLATATVLRIRPRSWGPALVAGLGVALDGGLMDTARSGAEGYLAPLWLGALALAVTGRDRPWSPLLAWACFSMAVMNHPFSLAAAPFLLLLPWRRPVTWLGALGGAALLLPQALALASLPGGAASLAADGGAPSQALPAWIQQGGPGAWILLAGAGAGLLSWRTRPLALALAASLALEVLLGWRMGYLRDHHLRLFTVPAAVGLAALPTGWVLGLAALLRMPPSQLPLPGHPFLPGTLGQVREVADRIVASNLASPLVVDGLSLGGPPVAEPSAVLLDLVLRGQAQAGLGGSVVVLVSGPRPALASLPMEKPGWRSRDAWFALAGAPARVRHALEPTCAFRATARAGGAWDGLAVLAPGTRMEDLETWWPPCLRSQEGAPGDMGLP